MHPAVKGVFSRLREAELELIIGVESCRLELALRTVNRVWNVVVVNPSHLRARFHRNNSGGERKIVDFDFRYGTRRCVRRRNLNHT